MYDALGIFTEKQLAKDNSFLAGIEDFFNTSIFKFAIFYELLAFTILYLFGLIAVRKGR